MAAQNQTYMTDKEQVATLLKLMPEDIHNEADNLRLVFSGAQWSLGRLANRMYSWVVAERLPFTFEICCLAALVKVDAGSSLSVFRVMDYARADAFFSQIVARGDFDIVFSNLPFSHLEYAYQLQAGLRWREVLEWDVEQAGLGKRPSLKALKVHFEPESHKADAPAAVTEEQPVRKRSATISTPPPVAPSEVISLLSGLSAVVRGWSEQYPRKARLLAAILEVIRYLSENRDVDLDDSAASMVDAFAFRSYNQD